MRTALPVALAVAFAAAITPALAGANPPAKSEHPGEVALIQEGNGWAYKHFPTNLTLYTYDKDPPNKSVCNDSCAAVWPPIVPHEDAKPMGDWTLVKRDDGREQWAYQGHPVYVRYHDSPEKPSGNGVDGVWHTLEP